MGDCNSKTKQTRRLGSRVTKFYRTFPFFQQTMDLVLRKRELAVATFGTEFLLFPSVQQPLEGKEKAKFYSLK